ncbi:MAG TPA: phosphoadenylyl-sulfate reductase [Beijerinckiaceae bacterium]|nr:phosphoadenylyl-sulfate reductase [Beijerinckiaceae bacterium]
MTQSESEAEAAESTESLAWRLEADFSLLEARERLIRLREEIAGRIVFTTSFGLEDQILTHLIASEALDVEIVTLDTGRLFPQTYALWAESEARFGRRIRAVYPDRVALENLVADQGIDGFYAAVAMRKACCAIRKVEPLGRALDGASAWITGLRADQSAERKRMPLVEFDADRRLIKANPLLDWTREEAIAFAKERSVPINPLHAAGFLSIGCAPCTRAVQHGESERNGRWWWESEDEKECGLHVGPDGRLVRGPQIQSDGAERMT